MCDRWWVVAVLEGVAVFYFKSPAGAVGRLLSGNQLSGSIPVGLGKLTALTKL